MSGYGYSERNKILVGNAYRVEDCQNCGVARRVDDDGYVVKCRNCGDDEWNIWEEEGKP